MTASVTIDDVAAKAGVSIKTVSRVVNREPNVRENTRVKVQAVIDALNYRPNQAARGLAGRRSYLIGLLYDNPSANYLANLQAGALAACHDRGYGLALCPLGFGEPDLEASLRSWLRHTQVDGVLVTPPLSDVKPLTDLLESMQIPAVIVSSKGPGNLPAVIIDDEAAAFQMTGHLIEQGHKHIAFIKGHPDHYASGLRYSGFLRGLQEAGLKADMNLVKQGNFDFDSGMAAAEALLSLAQRPSAIFASNDDMAAGVLHAVHQLNIAVPKEIAVVGFDDTPLSRQIWPSLTTIRQPIRLMGNQAAELLLQGFGRNTEGTAEIRVHQLDFDLKIRGSSLCKRES